MTSQILDWLARHHVGVAASVLGLLVSLGGFAFTIVAVLRSKRASEAAAVAVLGVKERISKFDVSTALSETLAAMREVKRLHRLNTWELLPERYDSLRRSLVKIRAAEKALTDPQRRTLQSAIQHFASMEKQVEKFNASGKASPSIHRLNSVVTSQQDSLTELMSKLRMEED